MSLKKRMCVQSRSHSILKLADRRVNSHAAEVAIRESERLIRESEAKLRVMADSLPSQIWVHDAEGNLLFINQAYRDFYHVQITCDSQSEQAKRSMENERPASVHDTYYQLRFKLFLDFLKITQQCCSGDINLSTNKVSKKLSPFGL